MWPKQEKMGSDHVLTGTKWCLKHGFLDWCPSKNEAHILRLFAKSSNLLFLYLNEDVQTR